MKYEPFCGLKAVYSTCIDFYG